MKNIFPLYIFFLSIFQEPNITLGFFIQPKNNITVTLRLKPYSSTMVLKVTIAVLILKLKSEL